MKSKDSAPQPQIKPEITTHHLNHFQVAGVSGVLRDSRDVLRRRLRLSWLRRGLSGLRTSEEALFSPKIKGDFQYNPFLFVFHLGGSLRRGSGCLVLVCTHGSVGLSDVTDAIYGDVLEARDGGQLLTTTTFGEGISTRA